MPDLTVANAPGENYQLTPNDGDYAYPASGDQSTLREKSSIQGNEDLDNVESSVLAPDKFKSRVKVLERVAELMGQELELTKRYAESAQHYPEMRPWLEGQLPEKGVCSWFIRFADDSAEDDAANQEFGVQVSNQLVYLKEKLQEARIESVESGGPSPAVEDATDWDQDNQQLKTEETAEGLWMIGEQIKALEQYQLVSSTASGPEC